MPIEKIRDNLYIKKGLGGYRVVHPIKKDLEKPANFDNINWYNLLTGGSIWNLIKVIIFIGLILLSVIAYKHDTDTYKKIVEEIYSDPYKWCAELPAKHSSIYDAEFNLSKFDKSIVKNNSS